MDKKQPSVSSQELSRLDQEIANNKLIQQILIEEQSPLRTLYEWTAPERVYTPKGRTWYIIAATVAMLFIVYFALTNNLVAIFLVISLMLVIYSLYSIPPQKTQHRITNRGINSFGNLYLWKYILYFWVTKRGDENIINIEFKEKPTDLYFQRMFLLTGQGDLQTIVTQLIRHIDYLNSNQTSIISKYIEGEYIPLLKILNLATVAEAEEEKNKTEEKTK